MSIIPSRLPAGILHAGEGERYFQLGTYITFKSLGHETDGGSFMWENETPPGAIVPPHIHQTEDEFIYLVEGEMEVTIGAVTHSVEDGRPGQNAARSTARHPQHWYGPTKSLWTVIPAGKMESFFRTLAALPVDQPPSPEVFARLFAEHDLVLLPPGQ